MALGSTLQLHTTMKPAGATSDLSWTSSNKKVVSVASPSGIVAGAKVGSATITVKTANGKSAKITVKVYDPKVATSIALKESGTVKLALGSTLQLNASMKPATATNKVSWSSTSKKIAKVDKNGLVTPVKAGTVTITVKTSNGKKDTVKVKVYDPKKATSITLKESGTVELALGSTLQLNATMKPATATSKISWSSSNKKVAKVDKNGLITPVKAGTVTITVKTSNGKKDTVKVKVYDPKKATSITLEETGTVKLKMGETLQLHASMKPVTATSKISWKSSNKKVAKVDKNGLVTPVKPGTVTITVKTSNGKKDTVKVKVIK